MGTVPISVIYGHKYPLSPIPAPKAGPSTPPSHRSSSVWPSSLAREPPQLVQRRKYENGVTVTNGTNGLDTADTAQKKTRGCLSYISSLRNRQTTTTTATTTVTREPTTSSFNATSYSFKSLARATTVSPSSCSAYSSYYGRSSVARAQD